MGISDDSQKAVAKSRRTKGKNKVLKSNEVLERLNIQYMDIGGVKPNAYNPNRQSEHDFRLLCLSMEEDGFTQPIIATKTKEDNQHVIVDGEHRWRAAATIGLTEIPVVLVDMSSEQMRISTIRHNRARGSHDLELEAEVLRDLQRLGAIEWAQDSLMMSDVELDKLLEDVKVPDALSDDDFSDAWVPSDMSEEDATLIREGVTSVMGDEHVRKDGATQMTAMTQEAIEMTRKRETLIKQAITQEDRNTAMQESAIYRVSLVFSGDEAEIIKSVLGKAPAEKLLTLCKGAMNGNE